MYQSPNNNKKAKYTNRTNPYAWGNNNLNARLNKAIKIILTSEYYEGSDLGQYYKKYRPDGKSSIYVDQPHLESNIKDLFIDDDSDCVKYLVGPTGIGKTTLIRNVFHVFDRKAVLNNNNLIIYVSFYSMMNSENDGYYEGEKRPIINTIATAFREAIDLVDGTTLSERIAIKNVAFYKELYAFIQSNNKLLENSITDFNIDEEEARKAICLEKYLLNTLEKTHPLDYNMSLFKYYLNKYERKNGRLFDNIFLILDDIESAGKIAKVVVEQAYHIRKCLQAYKSEQIRYHCKCLIAMRNYSFRNDAPIIKEAKRTFIGTDLQNMEDIILKDTVPTLQKIIDKRTDYILKHQDVITQYSDKNSYDAAANILKIVLTKVYGKYDKMLLSLTHNNIYSSMTLLFRIITNKQFIGRFEMDRTKHDGSFVLSDKDYSFDNAADNPYIPGNIDVFYALAYGENNLYFDTGLDYYLTNIMHYKENDGIDTELMGLYIIMYLITKKINLADEDYDGLRTINVLNALREMIAVFDFHTIEDKEAFRNGAHEMMKKLYSGGVLRQSLVSPIENSKDNVREYSDDLNVYLSKRGFQLYNMLTYNALLLSVYRDDIDTDLENNNVRTIDLSTTNRLTYCMQYINHLIEKEMDLFRQVNDYSTFADTFGTLLATPALLKGVEQSIIIYYSKDTSDKKQIINLYNSIGKKLNNILSETNKKYKTSFELVHLINY